MPSPTSRGSVRGSEPATDDGRPGLAGAPLRRPRPETAEGIGGGRRAILTAPRGGTIPSAMTHRPAFYITTAISYPNGRPHIGHAYELIAADAIARFKRLDGHDVRFLTGTDEHGQKMVETAAKEGITPAELADRNTPVFREMARRLSASNDDFISTREPRHYRSCQALWERIAAAGDIYFGQYGGWYSVRDEAFYTETETVLGEDGIRCGPTGTPVAWMEEESYFFRLSAYQDRLLDLYEREPGFIQPEGRRNEIVSFVRSGLKDLSVSRTTLRWGIPVPGDPNHVMYVWIDALTNYITAVGYPDAEAPLWRYWPANVHVIGKDIARFHAVYWPAFLMSAGVPVPRRVFAHGFLFNRGEKMSKSVGNVVDPFALADVYGVDPLRYFLLREVPFGQDGNYSHEAIVARINADLANDLGNLAQRSLSMIAKNCEGTVPVPGPFSEADRALLDRAAALLPESRAAMEDLAIHHYVGRVFEVVAEANRYFAAEQPWALRKTDPERMATVLFVTAEVVRRVAILLQPVMPDGAGRLLDTLGVPADARTFDHLVGDMALRPGTGLPAPTPVFPRFVEPETEERPAAAEPA